MNKAIMLSIQPKWCELIASGKKTIEVRKTASKLKTPFKCYIYKTFGRKNDSFSRNIQKYFNCGKVVGEFVCDKVENIMVDIDENDHVDYLVTNDFLSNTCLSFNEICRYLRNSDGYGWHISDLKIYDKPKELGEFWKADKCPYNSGNSCTYKYYCFRTGESKSCGEQLARPPQSWMYVEEV